MNLNWYNNFVDWNVLEGSGLDVWIASYGDTILAPSASKYKYTIWQCTAGDEVSGMISTKKLISGVPKENNVDLNFGYVDYHNQGCSQMEFSGRLYPCKTAFIFRSQASQEWLDHC